MRFSFVFTKLSLKARLILSYLVILGIGGLVTSIVGSWIVSTTIMTQARRAVDHDFATARIVYDQQLEALKLSLQFAASGAAMRRDLASGDRGSLAAYLEQIRRDAGFDFVSLTDRQGRVVARASGEAGTGGLASSIGEVKAALSGKVAAATELLSVEQLSAENPTLRERAHMRINSGESTEGMTLVAAAPIEPAAGGATGALYGGILLSGNPAIVNRVWRLLFGGDGFTAGETGVISIFQGDHRILTSIQAAGGESAIGTAAPSEVREPVLHRGEIWKGRTYVVHDWYIGEYAPIRDHGGARSA